MLLFNRKKFIGRKYGDYTIIKPVGEGRYGICFLARSGDGRAVIIKRFKPSIFKKNKEKNAYEAVILSQLHHRAIPELLGVINDKGFYAFILELKPGYSVNTMLFKHRHQFRQEEVFKIGFQLLDILQYLHDNGVVHRDIRLANVLIDHETVYLIDFGLARWADDGKYKFDIDFSFLGDFLLYLLYSSYIPRKKKRLPWYQELSLTAGQKDFLKKLLRLEKPYISINEVKKDFCLTFGMNNTVIVK